MLILSITVFLNYHMPICEGLLGLVYFWLSVMSRHHWPHAVAYFCAFILAGLLALGSALAQ